MQLPCSKRRCHVVPGKVHGRQCLFVASVCKCWMNGCGQHRVKLIHAVTSDTSVFQLPRSIECGPGGKSLLSAAGATAGSISCSGRGRKAFRETVLRAAMPSKRVISAFSRGVGSGLQYERVYLPRRCRLGEPRRSLFDTDQGMYVERAHVCIGGRKRIIIAFSNGRGPMDVHRTFACPPMPPQGSLRSSPMGPVQWLS